MGMSKVDARATLDGRRRKLIETYLLMGFGAAVLIWGWVGDFPSGEEFWMLMSGMLALFYGESLLTFRTAKIEEAEAIFEEPGATGEH
ncbi:MAG: hypothetical protein ACJAZN_000328 [Planctomycetota bacterium]|jgi:hypothetical protein